MQLTTESRIALFLFSLLLAVVLCSIPLYSADETGYAFRSNTNEVRLAFSASDREGHVVKTLRPSDVAVADNGTIVRHFRSFRSDLESPLDLVILLDASDSMASRIPAEVAEIVKFVANTNWRERDHVSILAFGGVKTESICARNCNAQSVGSRLNSLHASGATPLFDALYQATEVLKANRDSESRPALILFSDGMDTISMHSVADVLEQAQNLQSAIYAVNFRSPKSAPDQGDAMLSYLSGSTGGLSFVPGQGVKSVLDAVLDDLHSGYIVTYDLPTQTEGHHSVRILPTSNPKLQFRSRLAYNDAAE